MLKKITLIVLILVNTVVAQVKSAEQKKADELLKKYQDSAIYQSSTVIELFSSEGCNTCPFADEFMKEIIAISDSTKSMVYVLDFHVDIWNKSGWVDAFSDSNYTKRMEQYLVKKGWPNMYTPMAILNGKEHQAGHNRKDIGMFINKSFEQPSKYFMRIGAKGVVGEDSVAVNYRIWGKTDSLVVNVALVQRAINSNVTGGENAGQVLHHHNVVKQFASAKVTQEAGSVKIKLNPNYDLDNFRILAYIQNTNTWEVLAADQLNLTK